MNNIGLLIEETIEELESDFEITIEEPTPRTIEKKTVTKAVLVDPMTLIPEQERELSWQEKAKSFLTTKLELIRKGS